MAESLDEHLIRVAKLEDIRNQLNIIANSFAGDETGHLAVSLHHTAGLIHNVIEQATGVEPHTGAIDLIMPDITTIRNLQMMEQLRK